MWCHEAEKMRPMLDWVANEGFSEDGSLKSAPGGWKKSARRKVRSDPGRQSDIPKDAQAESQSGPSLVQWGKNEKRAWKDQYRTQEVTLRDPEDQVQVGQTNAKTEPTAWLSIFLLLHNLRISIANLSTIYLLWKVLAHWHRSRSCFETELLSPCLTLPYVSKHFQF